MKGKGPVIAIVILALLLLLTGWWGMQQNKQKNQLLAEKEELFGELKGLEEVKTNLETEVADLRQQYSTLAEENESLQGTLAETQKQLVKQQSATRAAKNNAASEINNLRAEIQALMEEKSVLQNAIAALQTENDSLRVVTGTLERDLSVARDENASLANLNRAIQEELKQLTLANFKATAFQVEVEQRNTKATSRSGRARRILVSFDLANVPEEFQGVRPVYLTITDEKATPIKVVSPVTAEIVVNGQPMTIQALEGRNVNITSSQRLNFAHELDDKLAPGYYRAAVYTDIGLLGASSFRLR